ncbi:hypothetical protein [Aliiruegeria haliotis]|nr:hypothetical protein [Aliiruegeria haliotis]
MKLPFVLGVARVDAICKQKASWRGHSSRMSRAVCPGLTKRRQVPIAGAR